jgi:hypothetical protein
MAVLGSGHIWTTARPRVEAWQGRSSEDKAMLSHTSAEQHVRLVFASLGSNTTELHEFVGVPWLSSRVRC